MRYFGVLSSHSKLRREVVPSPPQEPERYKAPPAAGDQLELSFGAAVDTSDELPSGRKRWAWLLAHVFRADLDTCPKCGGPMRWAQVANDLWTIRRILIKHGLAPRTPPPPYPPPSPKAQLRFGFS